ncbi:T9SS type A sorting domain-containing protein [Flavobacterium chuncheonense]|uniref:T9SS type A sorting domain-containing protein n=1 Tax=Flavobacterium chuncheonense TaxID=2026653 RepID=A0ABW5YL84_9FLAO
MKTKILLIILAFTTFCKAQIVNIPDNNLKTALLNHIPMIDLNSNGEIETIEAQSITDELILNGKSISDFTGIETFINVKKINLSDNNLASTVSTPLDFNSLLLLEELDLSDNNQILAVNCNQVIPLKGLFLDRYVSSVLLNSQTQLLELKCASATFQSLSAYNKMLIQKLNIYIIETGYPDLPLGTLNNLTELYLDSYFNGVYLNTFTGLVPNLYKISFNNISISSSISFAFLSNIREFSLTGSSSDMYLYDKIYTLANLKKLTLNPSWSTSAPPSNVLNFSNNPQLEYIYIYLSPSTALYLPINLTNNLNLNHLELYNYNSNAISLNNNIQLENLNISTSRFTSPIDLTNNINLKKLRLNSVASSTIPGPYTLNLSQNQLLEEVSIFDEYLNNINFGNVYTINKLEILQSKLETIDFSSFFSLIDLNFNSTKDILEIDLNNCTNLDNVIIKLATSSGNNIYPSNFIKLKNGSIESLVNIEKYDSDLKLCTDDDDTTSNWIFSTSYNATNFFSTYCNFTPGGFYNTISGKISLDSDSNGCDINDITVNNIKVVIDDTTESGYTFTNSNGEYEFYTQSNTVTITPYPNINYYIQSPQFSSVTFLNQEQQQDFCVVSNGIHNDLEINIIPINPARPGFDAKYKIIYVNKGTQTQSGTIDLTYDDSVMDFVSAILAPDSQSTNSLSWNFLNLLPFESREIEVVFNLNTPIENPPLNSGDILIYSASILGLTDENPIDNQAILNQTVVNSYDPNDKTCIEGTTIAQNQVGEYVHYLIRFENTGTFAAQNIVVKDIIDQSKFEINSLQPISSSHPLTVKAVNNVVEFIFEDINLPFDDANNDGYVAFKIKTKPDLVIGSTFSNSASIYFDYNFPIITNNYTTVVQNTLGLQENNFISDITIYPNPVKNILQFKTEKKITKVEIYDVLGRIISSNWVTENKIDLRELRTGNYILKLYTEKEMLNVKIIKE